MNNKTKSKELVNLNNLNLNDNIRNKIINNKKFKKRVRRKK